MGPKNKDKHWTRKSLSLSKETIAWLERQAERENRSVSNFVETFFQGIIQAEANE